MAMKPCKECGKEVSTKAKACPSCGAPVATGSPTGCVRGGCALLAFGFLGWMVWAMVQEGMGWGSKQPPPAPPNLATPTPDPPSWTAEKIRSRVWMEDQLEAYQLPLVQIITERARRDGCYEVQTGNSTQAAAFFYQCQKTPALAGPWDQEYIPASEVLSDEALSLAMSGRPAALCASLIERRRDLPMPSVSPTGTATSDTAVVFNWTWRDPETEKVHEGGEAKCEITDQGVWELVEP